MGGVLGMLGTGSHHRALAPIHTTMLLYAFVSPPQVHSEVCLNSWINQGGASQKKCFRRVSFHWSETQPGHQSLNSLFSKSLCADEFEKSPRLKELSRDMEMHARIQKHMGTLDLMSWYVPVPYKNTIWWLHLLLCKRLQGWMLPKKMASDSWDDPAKRNGWRKSQGLIYKWALCCTFPHSSYVAI